MLSSLLNQLVTQQEKEDAKYQNVTMVPYKVNDTVYKVPKVCHPGGVANRILNIIDHTKYFGIQVVSPPGSGKTSIAKVIAHHIHKKRPEFVVHVETENDTHAFEGLDRYIHTIPKKPTIVIFDDVSGVFGKMKEADIDKNFETLTRVRWVLDPDKGSIPFIPILTYHYSKVVEKKFRSQNGMSIFCTFGNEEKTNADTIAPRKTGGRMTLNQFEKITDTMFPHHYFEVRDSNGGFHRYETDKPFRAAAVIAGNVGSILMTSKDDVCQLCDRKSAKKKADPDEIVRLARESYGLVGIQALRQYLSDHGIKQAVNPNFWNAKRFISEQLMTKYIVDLDAVMESIYRQYKTGVPKKKNRKLKAERDAMKMLDKIAMKVYPDVKKLATGEEKFDDAEPQALTDSLIHDSAI